MSKKGGDFEIIAIDFLEKIFNEINYTVVRKRPQNSGSQDGYDNLIEIVDEKFKANYIYSECKDYTTELNYTDAIIKLPQLSSTHEKIDLALFISPKRNFTNIFEETRNKPFLESLANSQFKVAFLSPETYVQDYLSLYPELYKKVYLTDSPILNNSERLEILQRFEKFIFSDKNLSKIIIDESDKENFIGKLENNDFHIERTVRNSQNRELFYFDEHEKNSLENVIKKTDSGLVLLGNPGYGKSCELKQLAVDLWTKRNEGNWIPTFHILKYFSSDSNIEVLLPKNYKLIHNLIVILDGIDEIENIIDFSNKLRNFISENNEYIKASNMKFLISCRTNVYKKYIKNINNFETWYLNGVEYRTSIQFLHKKFNLDINEHKNFDAYKHRELLENPFYLDLIGKYYHAKNILLTNKAQLIDEYVGLRLIDDKVNKYQTDVNFDVDKIVSYTQKAAFALEAMQKPSMTSSEIKRVINVEEREFSKNPFLEENLDVSWSFVHKNIQEYFVAKLLQNLSFEDLINFVRIDSSTNKIHPTWHNVITFLLNLDLSVDECNKLIEWLLNNDLELLFNADTNRISDETKCKVLEDFFVKNCEEETLWINDPKQVANFAQNEQNIKYLISKMQNGILHRRARMSAIKILSNMEVGKDYYSELKQAIINIINEDNFTDENYLYLKQDAIMLTENIGLNQDTLFFNQLISLVKDRENKEIISSIINCVPDKSIEDNIDYFLEILDKSIGNKNWKLAANYNSITSTKENIFNLFRRMDNPIILLKIYSFLIERHKNYEIRENLIKDFLSYLKDVFKTKSDYHKDLIEMISNAVIEDKIRYFEDDLLLEIVKSCKIESQIFTLVLNCIDGNSSAKHFLAEITTEECFQEILDRYNSNFINDEFIQQFRNVLSNKDFKLSKMFEVFIESATKIEFVEKITIEELEERKGFWQSRDQNNFDTLFNTEKIVNQISRIYAFLGKNELSYQDIDGLYFKYYENFDLQKEVTENSKRILNEILSDNYSNGEKLNIVDLQKEVENSKFYIMIDILNSLPDEKKEKKISISEEQKKYIENWCTENTEVAKDNYINHISIKESWNSNKYLLFEGIYKFQKIFKFNLDETLLLDMIWFNKTEQGIIIEYMEGIVSREKINERILINLKNGKLSPSGYCNHLKYCVENKIDFNPLNLDLKNKIYEFLNSDHYYYATELLEIFFSNDSKTLIEFLNYNPSVTTERKKSILDNIFSILLKNNHDEIVKEFIKSNYEKLISEKTYQEIEIIRKLVSLNCDGIFDNFYSLVKIRIKNSEKGELDFRDYDWQKYSKKTALNKLVDLFELCLSTPNIDELFGKFYHPIRISSETIINICKSNNEEVCIDAMRLLQKIDIEKIKELDGELFYYHKLQNDIQEIYYSHKSKPFPFTEVLKVLDQNKHLFIN